MLRPRVLFTVCCLLLLSLQSSCGPDRGVQVDSKPVGEIGSLADAYSQASTQLDVLGDKIENRREMGAEAGNLREIADQAREHLSERLAQMDEVRAKLEEMDRPQALIAHERFVEDMSSNVERIEALAEEVEANGADPADFSPELSQKIANEAKALSLELQRENYAFKYPSKAPPKPQPVIKAKVVDIDMADRGTRLLDDRLQRIRSAGIHDLDLAREDTEYAQLGGNDAALISSLVFAVTPPAPEDIAEDGVEVVFCDEVKDLADELGADPVAMWEWVRNNVDYEPYYGSLKGPRETLLTRAGNDFDQAGLLISMLRYSGYPARFVRNTVRLDIERAKNWLGIDDPQSVGDMLSSNRVPTILLADASGIKYVQFELTWAEVYTPYGRGRGVKGDRGRKMWIPLVPAFKQYQYHEGMDVAALTGHDAAAQLDEFAATATVNEGPDPLDNWVTGIDGDLIEQRMDEFADGPLTELIDSLPEGALLRDLTGYREIAPQNLGCLPASLPMVEPDRGARLRFSTADDSMRHRVKIYLSYWPWYLAIPYEYGGLDLLEVDYEAPLAALSGKRVTLSYAPWDAEAEALIAEAGGNMYDVYPAAYLHLKPQLKIDGEVVGDFSDAISIGLPEYLWIETLYPGEGFPTHRETENVISAGDMVSIVIDNQRVTKEMLDKGLGEMMWTLDDGGDVEAALGAYYRYGGLRYWMKLDAYNDWLAGDMGVVYTRSPSVRLVGHKVSYSWLLGMAPVSAIDYRVFLDFDRDVYHPLAKDGAAETDKGWLARRSRTFPFTHWTVQTSTRCFLKSNSCTPIFLTGLSIISGTRRSAPWSEVMSHKGTWWWSRRVRSRSGSGEATATWPSTPLPEAGRT